MSLPPRAKRIAEAVAPPGVRQEGRQDTGLPESAVLVSGLAVQAVASRAASGADGQEVKTEVVQAVEESPGVPSEVLGPQVADLPSRRLVVLFPASPGERVRRRRRRKRSRRKRAVTAALLLATAFSVWLVVWLAVIAGNCHTRAEGRSIAAERAGWESAGRIEAERPAQGEVWTCVISEIESRLLQGESKW